MCEFEANNLTREEFMIAEKEYTRENKTVYALEVRCSLLSHARARASLNHLSLYVYLCMYLLSLCLALPQAHGHFFDPTMRTDAVGKYINHAAKGANIKLFPPIEARGKLRIGFIALTSIAPEEELFFDYGYR